MRHPTICVVRKTPCCGEQVDFVDMEWTADKAKKRCVCGTVLIFGSVDCSCVIGDSNPEMYVITVSTSQKEHQ